MSWFLEPSKPQLSMLIGRYVIVRHNTFYAHMHFFRYENGTHTLQVHPRLGQVGIFLDIIEGTAKVKFERDDIAFIPLVNVFYFRLDTYRILEETLYIQDAVRRKYGIKAVEDNLAVSNAVVEGREPDALRLASKNIFAYHFLSFLNAPFNFHQIIYEQRDDDERFFYYRQLQFQISVDNILRDLDNILAHAHNRFKQTVMDKCNFTDAVYAKKVKASTMPFTDTDRDCIIEQADEILDLLTDRIKFYVPRYLYCFDEGFGRRRPCPLCTHVYKTNRSTI